MTDRRSPGRSLRRAGLAAATLAGAAAGASHALPVENVQAAGKCPPAREGLYYCVLQKAWLPAVVEVLLLATVAFLLFELVSKAPRMWRAINLERANRRAARRPPWETDTTLLAASWGNKYDDPAHPRPRRPADLPAMLAVPAPPLASEAPAAAAARANDPERKRRLAAIAAALDLADQLGLEPKPAQSRRAA